MDILESLSNLRNILRCNNLFEFFIIWFEHCFIKLTFFSILEYEIDGKLVFEMVVEFDYVGVVQAVHYFYLISDVVDHFLICNWFFLDLFDCIDCPCPFVLCLPDHTVCALAENRDVFEVRAIGLIFPARLHGWGEEHNPIWYFIHLHEIIISFTSYIVYQLISINLIQK